ncbi:MAG TPA: chromate resistance protein ChrB domain-containing protein [Gemmatimonadaceae bacterium]|nr:chromate resistance protein ChrB domain-containing protein [Gemmatimonadaceae bacterium]
MRWITRERPKIDRVACPWLIARFIDESAEFLFVPAPEVAERARETAAIPYDVEGVELSHVGERCSFDAFLAKYDLRDPALSDLATIVRGADTARLDLAPQCAGLLAISLGLSQLYANDHEQVRHGFVVYDALYAWLTRARDEKHTWNPQRSATAPA